MPETAFDFEAVRRAGTTPNGVFAAKIMWSHTPDLWVRLAGRTLEDVFGPLHYVQVMRRDKVAHEELARDPGPTIEILAGVEAPPSPLLRQWGSRSSAWAARFASEVDTCGP